VVKYDGVGQATDDSIKRRFACWATKATDIHLEFGMLIAFTRQQWLCERATTLCLYVYCLPCLCIT